MTSPRKGLAATILKRKRPFRRSQYHARITSAGNHEVVWWTEGYNNLADCYAALRLLEEHGLAIDQFSEGWAGGHK